MIKNIIADSKFRAFSPQGEESESQLIIGDLVEDADRGWVCYVEVKGIEPIRMSSGVDSLQALELGMSLAKCILEVKAKQGWKFVFVDEDEEILKNDFLGKVRSI